jgi:hypothetical protein
MVVGPSGQLTSKLCPYESLSVKAHVILMWASPQPAALAADRAGSSAAQPVAQVRLARQDNANAGHEGDGDQRTGHIGWCPLVQTG